MKIKTLIISLTLACLASMHITAAGQNEKPGTPQRIVIAGRATIMLMDALYMFDGMDEKVVARGETNQGLGDFFPVIDQNASEKPNLGKNPGPEEILSHNPDLVILKNYMKKSLGQPLEDLGMNVVYLDLETEGAIVNDIQTLGGILNQEKRAQKIIEYFADMKTYIESKAVSGPAPDCLFLYPKAGNGGYSFQIPSKGWIQEDQVTVAGGKALWTEYAAGSGWNDLSFEQIAAWSTDAVFIADYRNNPDKAVKAIMEDPLWADVPAAKNGKVYAVPADFYSWGQADTRWILGALWMASKLNPDQIPAKVVKEKTVDFFKTLYGLSDETIASEIIPRLPEDLR